MTGYINPCYMRFYFSCLKGENILASFLHFTGNGGKNKNDRIVFLESVHVSAHLK